MAVPFTRPRSFKGPVSLGAGDVASASKSTSSSSSPPIEGDKGSASECDGGEVRLLNELAWLFAPTELILCNASDFSGTLSEAARDVPDCVIDPGFDGREVTPGIDCLDIPAGREIGGSMEDLGALVVESALRLFPDSELRTVPLAEDIEEGPDVGVLVGDFVGD